MPRNTRRVTPILTTDLNKQEDNDKEDDNNEVMDETEDEDEEREELKQRAAKVKNKLRARFRKKGHFSVKCADLKANARTLSSSSSASSLPQLPPSSAHKKLQSLRRKNSALAAALNQRLLDNREVEAYNVQLKEENLGLGVEMGQLRKKMKEMETAIAVNSSSNGDTSTDKAAIEAEFQRRLVDYLEPVKECLTQVLGHTSALTDSLTRAMHLVSAPGRRSRSMAAMNATSILMQQKSNTPFGKSNSSGPAVAHVSPRVSGHAIHKPQIEIMRLGPDDIQRLQGNAADGAANDAEEEGDEEEESVEEEVEEEEEEQGAEETEDRQQARRQPQQRRFKMFRMSDIGEVEENNTTAEEEQEEGIAISSPRRRLSAASLRRSLNVDSPVVLLNDVTGLLREYDLLGEEDDEDGESSEEAEGVDGVEGAAAGGEKSDQRAKKVVLVPRLVLERVTIKERRSSASSQLNAQPNTRTKQGTNRRRSSLASNSQPERANLKKAMKSKRKSRQSSMGVPIAPDVVSAPEVTKPVQKKAVSRKDNPPEVPQKKDEKAKEVGKKPDAAPEQPKHQPSPAKKKSEAAKSETPKSRESHEEFQQRLFEVDPLEGPSWLFGPNNKAKRSKLAKEILERTRRSSSITLKAKVGEVSKKLDMTSQGDKNSKTEKEGRNTRNDSAGAEESAKNAIKTPSESPRSPKRSGSKIGTSLVTGTVETEGSVGNKMARKAPSTSSKRKRSDSIPDSITEKENIPQGAKRQRKIKFQDDSPSVPSPAVESAAVSPLDETSESGPPRGRSRRAAAAAANSSLKEPSLTKKLRQGDSLSNSIYPDFVPGTKQKLSGAGRAASGKKGNAAGGK